MSSPISGFTAIPNPQMLAFMPIQSYLMMYFAGSGWQYGKRKISAMSNEQFNKLTPEELLQQHSIELKNMLPTLERSLNDVTPLVRILIEQYGDFIKEAIKATPTAIATAGQGLQQQLFPASKGSLYDVVKHALETDDPLGAILVAMGGTQFGQSAGAHSATVTESIDKSFKDTSGQTLAQYEAIKKAESARLVAAKANRPKQIQQFGSTQITAQVSRDVTKRKAGQSAIMERNNLIKSISDLGQRIKETRVVQLQKILKKEIVKRQQRLINLLARYRF